MDTTTFRQKHHAAHLSRQAAAEAHSSYYAHPSLHFSSNRQGRLADPDHQDIPNVHPVNEPYDQVQRHSSQAQAIADGAPTTNQLAERNGDNELKKEEAGGMLETAPPTALDKGARELGGEAGGTHSSPGPNAQVVAAARQAAAGQSDGVRVDGALQLPNDKLKGTETHWSVARAMDPHLQLMCGPMLSYYTVRDGVWHGAALVVTADNGSVFNPPPTLTMRFSPYVAPSSEKPPIEEEILQAQAIPGQRIYTYNDDDGPCSFWRFMIQIPLQRTETSVRYQLNGGAEIRFCVPALGQNMRWTSHSCNGFSSGVNPDNFKGKNFSSGYDPMWEDMLGYHFELAYHCMVGGGDQIYCDAITREPELQSYITAPDRRSKIDHPLTDEIRHAVDRFYFNHYCKIFRSNAFGRANSTIPMVNMLDDHDLIDGFGTYDDATMASPVFSHIGSRGYFWFLLFQLFINDEVDGINHHVLGSHPAPSVLIGGPGAWIPFPSHHLGVYLGPKVSLVAIDCRAERKLTQIVTTETYNLIFREIIGRLPAEVEQLVVLLGVPIAYPRMSFLEHFLGAKYNPINALARRGILGLGGMVNKFDQASELLDDLNDHWCANTHKKERNWLVLEFQRLAMQHNIRITFLSGDVHLAAVGCLFTKKRVRKLEPRHDHRYMLNVITSAIVNTPPPAGAATMVAILSGNKHRTLHRHHTDERMLRVFETDTDGTPIKRPYVLARRNYAAILYNESTGELNFQFRVEKAPGVGETKLYNVVAPPPQYGNKSAAPSIAPSGATHSQPVTPATQHAPLHNQPGTPMTANAPLQNQSPQQPMMAENQSGQPMMGQNQPGQPMMGQNQPGQPMMGQQQGNQLMGNVPQQNQYGDAMGGNAPLQNQSGYPQDGFQNQPGAPMMANGPANGIQYKQTVQ